MKNEESKSVFHSIRIKLPAYIACVFIAFTVVLAITLSTVLKHNLQEMVQDDMQTVAEEIGSTIEEKLVANEDIIYALGNNPMLTDPSVTEEEKVEYYQKKASELGYNLFFYCNTSGHGVNLTPEGDTFEVADADYFKTALAGQNCTSPVIIDQLDGKKIVINAAPYYDEKTGEVIGVLCGIRNADFMTDVCEKVNWREGATVAVYDDSTNIVGHSDPEVASSGLNVMEALKTDSSYASLGNYFETSIFSNSKGVGTYEFGGKKHISGFYNIPNRGYTVLISLDNDTAFSTLHTIRNLIVVLAIVLTGVALAILYFSYIRKIVHSFIRMEEYLGALAEFDLRDVEYDAYENRRDEIGNIFAAMKRMRKNLKDIISNTKNFTTSISETSKEAKNLSNQSIEAADSVAQAFSEIATGATKQAQAVDDANSNVSELLSAMDAIDRDSATLLQTIKFTNQSEEKSTDALNALMQSNQEATRMIKEIAEAIESTNESANGISEAASLITNIANQTNLLSLNASIEAARAGEHGKGFAVVASEIQTLSIQSNDAAKSIHDIITKLVDNTSKSHEKMSTTLDVVNVQQTKLESTIETSMEVKENIKVLGENVDNITKNIDKCKRTTGAVSDIFSNLAAISEENSACAEETSASMMELNDNITTISNIVDNVDNISENITEQMNAWKF